MKRISGMFILLVMMAVMTGCFSQGKQQTEGSQKAEAKSLEESQSAEGDTLPPSDKGQGQVETSSSAKQEASKKGDPAPKSGQDAKNPTIQEKTESVSQGGESSSSSAPAAPVVTKENIEAKYKKELSALQTHYTGILQGIYSGALEDLKAGKLSKKAIYDKYAKRGTAIQEESQAQVNQVLYKMKNELKSHQLPTDVVDVFRESYYTKLDQVKNQAMDKVKQALL